MLVAVSTVAAFADVVLLIWMLAVPAPVSVIAPVTARLWPSLMLSMRVPDAFAKATEAAVAAVSMLNVPVPVRLAAVAELGTPVLQGAVLQFVPLPDQVVCPRIVWLRAAMVKMTFVIWVAKLRGD